MKIIEKSKEAKDIIYCLVKRKMKFLCLYTTNRCNSRCNICSIWSYPNKIDLRPEAVEKILSSGIMKKNPEIGLTGGEFILSPYSSDIFEICKNYTRTKNIILYSNGLLTKNLIDFCVKKGVERVQLSLDGGKETYKRMRGVDGYDKVIETIKNLKAINIDVRLTFVLSPLNGVKDYLHVKNICEKYNLPEVAVIVYDTREIFKPKIKQKRLLDLRPYHKSIYLNSFYKWQEGKLNLPCLNPRIILSVMENGDVVYCQNFGRKLIMGNVYNDEMNKIKDKIFETNKEYINCNQCWLSSQRAPDNLLHYLKMDGIMKKIIQS
jgi:MoaA/NifB/PqqE/SkfB family radical SAM enzyme